MGTQGNGVVVVSVVVVAAAVVVVVVAVVVCDFALPVAGIEVAVFGYLLPGFDFLVLVFAH